MKVLALILVCLGVASWALADGSRHEEMNAAALRAQSYLAQAVATPLTAAKTRTDGFARSESAEAYAARWTAQGGGRGLRVFQPLRVTFYDRGHEGAPADLAAVDFWLSTDASRFLCGFVLLDRATTPYRVQREEISVIAADRARALDDAALEDLMRGLSCATPGEDWAGFRRRFGLGR